RIAERRRSLKEKPNGDCVFYDRKAGCTIYPVRPAQCRTWPFWESNTATPADWKRTQKTCPGAGRGELISAEEITRRVRTIKLCPSKRESSRFIARPTPPSLRRVRSARRAADVAGSANTVTRCLSANSKQTSCWRTRLRSQVRFRRISVRFK